ncbi:MAG: FAD-containing monooxygenase EthA [Rhodobiaceae bacterium]|nr:MAG: FAD-containing monooxygenase EthA [Rhodobiaceae bacterium]
MSQHFDVLIVGVGISGVSAAYYLQERCPEKSYAILENQKSLGGTWRTHTYPGIRSDSDLFTFGYKFKPWSGAPIATADEILKYMNETVSEFGIDKHIRYQHQIVSASWSSSDNVWKLTAENLGTGETLEFTCNFLWMCQGYYRHSEGYTPEWEGMDKFKGQIVHPQTWPDDLDYKGKNVLVIGSGATAATIIPAMAEDCKHITMLQRSPTYFFPGENRNEVADMLRELDVPEEWTHEIVRQKILHDQKIITELAREHPDFAKEELIKGAREYLPEGYDMEKHFTPHYRPWRQRVAFVPDADLFKGITSGKASVVTDEIDSFTEKGVRLKSGETLEADIIITATGFNLSVLGDIDFSIDGEPLSFGERWTYRGIMYSGIPNMAWVFGYLRTSWTMRADLISEFVCRLLKHMDADGMKVCTPRLRDEDQAMPALPFIDPENFNPGYLMRAMHLMPKQGDHQPWIFAQDYYSEKDELPAANLDDGALVFV